MPKFPKNKGFSMRSGNGPLEFKQMGSSPAKHEGFGEHTHKHGGSGSYRKNEKGELEQTGIGGDIDKGDWPKGKNLSDKDKPGTWLGRTAKKAGKWIKENRSEIGEGLEKAGEGISRAYGKGGTGSMMTAYAQMDMEQKDAESQRILDRTRELSNQQKIDDYMTALNDEDKMPETQKHAKETIHETTQEQMEDYETTVQKQGG
jgi:hypothetical protein